MATPTPTLSPQTSSADISLPEQKREIIRKVIEAQPTKSNREIARQVKASPTIVGQERDELSKRGQLPDKTTGKDGKERPAKRKPNPLVAKDKAEVQKLWRQVKEAKAEVKRKPAAQESFDSPQAAHASKPAAPTSLDLGSLAFAWREVEAHAAAGNKRRLKGALQHLLKECSAALAGMRKGGA